MNKNKKKAKKYQNVFFFFNLKNRLKILQYTQKELWHWWAAIELFGSFT